MTRDRPAAPSGDAPVPRPKPIKRDLSNDHRPTIRLAPGEIARIVDESEAALIAASRGLYQRANKIVAIADAPAINAHGHDIITQAIAERGDHGLLEELVTAASFEKFDARANEYVSRDPPMAIIKTLKDRIGKLRFPILTGVINAPTLRADGSVLDNPGYDKKTGLMFDPLGATFPPIPDHPTRDDAQLALDLLGELIAAFPFVADQDRSVALSAILTACVRRALPTAPLHAFTAPLAGSGKSKLVEIASAIARGRDAPVIGQTANDDEFEKRLGAKLIEGASIIAIDNCTRALGGDLLCMLLTQQTVSTRVLGESKTPEMQTGAFVTATGNNLVITGDLARRALLCRIDPQVECPENRVFDFEPVALAKSNRPRYAVAALTILRAYHVAGRPAAPPPLGSFEEWSDLVRGALLWMGAADPVLSMDEVKMSDPAHENVNSVVSEWRAILGAASVTCAEVIKAATETRADFAGSELVNPDFRDALLAVAGQGPTINTKRLGQWLNANKDRIISGARFTRMGTRRAAGVWSLQTV